MATIELDGLTKSYGEVVANDGISLTVERGEIFGHLGPNGAGKTTTIRTLLGLLSPTAGEARVRGADVTDEPAHPRPARRDHVGRNSRPGAAA
jgi:ABC-2 type transport system ATP-binding protein